PFAETDVQIFEAGAQILRKKDFNPTTPCKAAPHIVMAHPGGCPNEKRRWVLMIRYPGKGPSPRGISHPAVLGVAHARQSEGKPIELGLAIVVRQRGDSKEARPLRATEQRAVQRELPADHDVAELAIVAEVHACHGALHAEGVRHEDAWGIKNGYVAMPPTIPGLNAEVCGRPDRGRLSSAASVSNANHQ